MNRNLQGPLPDNVVPKRTLKGREEAIEKVMSVIHEFFAALRITSRWTSYDDYVDTNKNQIEQYQYFIDSSGVSVSFIFPDHSKYSFYPTFKLQEKVFFDPNITNKFETSEDSKLALARICVEFIRKSVVEIDRKYPMNQQNYSHTQTPLQIADLFYQVLGLDPRNDQFKLWITYWSNPTVESACFSNCSGTCTRECQGKTCLYFFSEKEMTNPYLPNSEKIDPRNVFDDRLFWIAKTFSNFQQTQWEL